VVDAVSTKHLFRVNRPEQPEDLVEMFDEFIDSFHDGTPKRFRILGKLR